MKSLLRTALFSIGLLLWTGCESTQLQTTWRDPGADPLAFKKVAILVLNSSPAERRAQEEVMASKIKAATAVPSYRFLSDAELRDRSTVIEKVTQGGFDGAIVLHLIDATKEQRYVPGTRSYWRDDVVDPLYTPGHLVTDTVIRAEVSLYSVSESKLLWSGSSTTTNPANARDFSLQVLRAAAEELRKQRLLS